MNSFFIRVQENIEKREYHDIMFDDTVSILKNTINIYVLFIFYIQDLWQWLCVLFKPRPLDGSVIITEREVQGCIANINISKPSSLTHQLPLQWKQALRRLTRHFVYKISHANIKYSGNIWI